MRSLISDSFACWPFSTVLSQVFWQECFIEKPESVWLPLVPHLSLLELSAGILAILSPLLDSSKTCPVPACIPLYLSQIHGVGCGDFLQHQSMLSPVPLYVWFALVGGQEWSWSQWVCPWWFPAWLALPRSALCPASADLPVSQLWGLVHGQWHLSTTLWYSRKRRHCSIPFAAIAFRTDRPFLHFHAVVSTHCL